MKKLDRACLARIIMGGILGLVASVALVPYLTNARSPSLAACLLCTALGATLGAATLPFADDGPTLVRRSLLHLGVTALEVALVLWLCVDLRDGRAWALWPEGRSCWPGRPSCFCCTPWSGWAGGSAGMWR